MSYGSNRRTYSNQYPQQRRRGGAFSGLKLRLLIAGAIVLYTLVSYYNKGERNPVTGKIDRVDMTINEEIQMGFSAVPSMGQPSANRQARFHVQQIGNDLVNRLDRELAGQGINSPYDFQFHLLADQQTVNAFALPGGQVFITEALYRALGDGGTDAHNGRLAGVLGHEVGHVLERHGAQRMAKGNLFKWLASAAGVAGGDVNSGRAASWVGNMINMKYGREDELESDEWGLRLMVLAGYNPEHLLEVMNVLERTSGGGGTPEFMSTHPRPANRREYIQDLIGQIFPQGVPANLR